MSRLLSSVRTKLNWRYLNILGSYSLNIVGDKLEVSEQKDNKRDDELLWFLAWMKKERVNEGDLNRQNHCAAHGLYPSLM